MTQLSLARNKVSVTDLKSHWFWRAVLFPFALVRLAQLMVIYFGQVFPPFGRMNPPAWDFQLNRFINIWANWDSNWYLSIIKEGYHLNGPVDQAGSNIAFYPLYPYLVKIISWPVYHFIPKDSVLIGFGVLLSNVFLLGALFLLYKLVLLFFDSSDLAERTILYLLVFPSAIFFSCFYTEAAFLFFAVAAFYCAKQGKWQLAGIMAACVSLARPLGFLIAAPLGLIYLESIAWDIRKIRADVLWLGLAPAALAAYMAALTPVTGSFLAIFQIQAAWKRNLTDPITTLLAPPWSGYSAGIYEIDHLSLLLFSVLSILALFKLPSLSFGVFPLLIIGPILLSGQVMSATRHCAVLFPGFILLAKYGKNEMVHKLILIMFFTLQMIFMAAWSREYWVQ